MHTDNDSRYMREAVRLARKAEGLTSPNPLVGAVIVKDGKIVGKGYHKRAGLAHAEAAAIGAAKENCRGATLYVTLEPCVHFGRTPPCCDAIIRSGIKNVVTAMKDPNPINNGKGIKKLRASGINVKVGVLKKEAGLQNKPFIKFVKKALPYVTVKVAQSLDGKIAALDRRRGWLSSLAARRLAHELRAKSDAVMVGINTVLSDDPMLTARLSRFKKNPARVVVDSELKIPLDSKLVKTCSQIPLIVAATSRAQKSKIKKLRAKGAEALIFKEKKGRVPLRELLKELGKKGILSVLVEGGGSLIGSLHDERLADRFMFILVNKIIGGKDSPTSVGGNGIRTLGMAARLKNLNMRRLGNDFLFEGEL